MDRTFIIYLDPHGDRRSAKCKKSLKAPTLNMAIEKAQKKYKGCGSIEVYDCDKDGRIYVNV